MIDVFENKKCCGCNACINICPVKCISNKTDEKGFAFPIVDTSVCIGCNQCDSVCPMLNSLEKAAPLSTEGMINNDDKERVASSSGGIFSILAKEIINKGGVVYGASFDENFKVVHTSAETIEDIAKFRGSKYIQSDINLCFTEVKTILNTGRWVLFSGTPCQVKGLHLFLKKSYEKLLTVDFICHGVPNYEVFKAYIEDEKRKSPSKFTSGISSINFRDKSHAGWHGYCLAFTTRDNSHETIELKNSAFMRGFGANLYLRPSCYDCPAKDFSSGADITLADYWRVEKLNPELDDNKGTSLVSILTEKGMDLISKYEYITRKKVDAKEAYRCQIALRQSMPLTEKSDTFWESNWRSDFINIVNEICDHHSVKQNVKFIIKGILRAVGVKKLLSIFWKRFR